MSESPLVTVVMPTWNRLPFVEEAAKSVIAQTYRHWELIVIDDGSTDGTADRLNALKDPRIRVLSSPHVGHIGQLRNRGVTAGSGEFIAFLDSDDVWLARKLEVQLKALHESGAGWSYSRIELMDVDGCTIPLPVDKFRQRSGEVVREMLTFSLTVFTSTIVVRRDLFDGVGRFSEDPCLLVGEDYELYLRLALRAPTVAVPDALTRLREHPGRITAGDNNPYEIKARIYEFFLAGNPDSSHARLAHRLRARSLADEGAQLLSAGKLGRAVQLFGRSARHGAHVGDWARALARGIRDGVLRRPRPGTRG